MSDDEEEREAKKVVKDTDVVVGSVAAAFFADRAIARDRRENWRAHREEAISELAFQPGQMLKTALFEMLPTGLDALACVLLDGWHGAARRQLLAGNLTALPKILLYFCVIVTYFARPEGVNPATALSLLVLLLGLLACVLWRRSRARRARHTRRVGARTHGPHSPQPARLLCRCSAVPASPLRDSVASVAGADAPGRMRMRDAW